MKTKTSKQREVFGFNYTVTDDKMTITIDLAHRQKPSSTGKTMLVASTGGMMPIHNQDGSIRKETFSMLCYANIPNSIEITKNYLRLAEQTRLTEAILRSLEGQHFLLAHELGVNLEPEETV